MTIHTTLNKISQRIEHRSAPTRESYLERMEQQTQQGLRRQYLSCTAQAHAYAASPKDEKLTLVSLTKPHFAIVSAYNDMLSAHQPFKNYPDFIKQELASLGATAQVASGVPAMCDGITQGSSGMELSLFSRDIIALSSAIGLSHNVFDGAVYLGICDKIAPGMCIAAANFGYLPTLFMPAGPMTSNMKNDEKASARKKYARGLISREELLKSEMKSYHSGGTCTFYGTANTNQMLLEVMGLQLPGSSFVNPGTAIRHAFNKKTLKVLMQAKEKNICGKDIFAVKNFVNAIVVLNATGGSTNLVIHLVAMAKASGIILTVKDIADISNITPVIAKVYPNSNADINYFHSLGGVPWVIKQLHNKGLLHPDCQTILGNDINDYCQEAFLDQNEQLVYYPVDEKSADENILTTIQKPFSQTGGITHLTGNIGEAVIKSSAVKPEHFIIHAPARVFSDQDQVKAAYKANELNQDCVIIVRFQGPKCNGMPELHSLTPMLSNLQDLGYRIAIVTDGRMSGASGTVPAAIHLTPEASAGGYIGRIQEGDLITLDINAQTLTVHANLEQRENAIPPEDRLLINGTQMFHTMRKVCTPATEGATTF